MSMRVFLPLVLLAAGSVPAQPPGAGPTFGAPAQNWEMKIFTREGFRSMILRGTEARIGGENRYDVIDLNITTFSGTADARVESIFLSPSASFFTKETIARGDKSVRLIREDMEITGEQWTYFHAQQKVSIQKNNRVVFHAALPDLLR
jgi:hypothetical protein